MVCNDSRWGRELVCSLHRHDQLPFFFFFLGLLVAHINYCFFPFVVVIGWWCTVIGWLGFVVWYDWQKAARSGAGRPVQEAFYYSWILPGVYYESHRPSEGQGKLDVNSHGSGKWGMVCCGVCMCNLVCVWSNWKAFFSRNESCRTDLCWDLASDIRWLQFCCTTWWTYTSYCCCCNILDVCSSLNFFILLCSFTFHVWPHTAFRFQFLQLLEQKIIVYSGMNHPKVLYASKCFQAAVSLCKCYSFGKWASLLYWETLWLLVFICYVSHHRYSLLFQCNIWIIIIKLTYSHTPLVLEKEKCLFQDILHWATIYIVQVASIFKQMAWRIILVFHKYIFYRTK